MSKHVCQNCGQFTLKQITSKSGKNAGKKFWVCQAPEEVCDAIYPDDNGKPDFPEENPDALTCLEWLAEEERWPALTEWERDFIAGLVEKAESQLDKPLAFSQKQLGVIRKIADKFAAAPEF